MQLSRRCEFRSVFHVQRVFCSSGSASTSTENADEQTDEFDKRRDISRLLPYHRTRLFHALSPPEPMPMLINDVKHAVKNRRKIYARYGQASGIDPGYLWPSKEQLSEMIEEEKDLEPTLQERWERIDSEKNAVLAERRKKEALVEKQLGKMPEFIKQYKGSLVKAEELKRKQEEKKEALRAEAREYFGFDINPSDPRFIQMQEMKAEQEKLDKKKKKKAKQINIRESATMLLKRR